MRKALYTGDFPPCKVSFSSAGGRTSCMGEEEGGGRGGEGRETTSFLRVAGRLVSDPYFEKNKLNFTSELGSGVRASEQGLSSYISSESCLSEGGRRDNGSESMAVAYVNFCKQRGSWEKG